MQLKNEKKNTIGIASKFKIFFQKNKKIILIIGGVIAVSLVIFLVLQLFRDRRTVIKNDQYIIEYDRSDDMYIVSPNKSFSSNSLTEIYSDLQKLCKNPDDIDSCTLFNLPGIFLGTQNEELKQIQENQSEIQKVIDEIKQGKKSFGSYEQSPTRVD